MNDQSEDPRPRPWWLLPLLLGCVLIGVIALRGFVRPALDTTSGSLSASDPVDGETVSLVIDFGNGARREFAAIKWRGGMTVEQLMAGAASFRPGITYQQKGTGSTAFLTEIDGIGGQSGDNRYWQYWVNDERADRSFGSYELRPGDRVLWKFAPQE